MQMQFDRSSIEFYLESSQWIDSDNPLVINKALALTEGVTNEVDKARILFEFVRDQIDHSNDIGATVVTRPASEVLEVTHGTCYVKACLLAALLRTVGIPAGLCYQLTVLEDDIPGSPLILHGFNAVYLASLKRWIRVDARGNKEGVNALFDLEQEQLAFPVRPELDEIIYPVVFHRPPSEITACLEAFQDVPSLWANLPISLDLPGTLYSLQAGL